MHNLIKQFEQLNSKLRKAQTEIRGLDCKHLSLVEIQKKNIDQLEKLLERLAIETNCIKNDIVWDHLVVGFFGETNAGKSTIIETLRLKYSADKDSWVHGSIVGTGVRDYTKDSSEYELNINGRRVTLIDIPGIEGEEAKYAEIIRRALRKAHFVFYVHPKIKPADECIALSIKSYLADWTRVYSIWNINQNPSYYESKETQKELLTPELKAQGEVLKASFRNILGSDLFIDQIPVQALIGLSSCSTFPDVERLNKKAKKLKSYFGDEETLYNFSNFGKIVEILEQSCDTYEQIIIASQRQKLIALKYLCQRELTKISHQQDQYLEQLSDRLAALKSDVKRQFDSMLRGLENKCCLIISQEFGKVRSNIETAIDSGESLKTIKSNISSWVNSLKGIITQKINAIISDSQEELTKCLNKRFDEFSGILITSPNLVINVNISLDIDVPYIIKKLKVSLNDLLDVASMAASGATVGGILGNWIGMGIGAGVGAIVGVIGKKVLGDGGKSKAKKAVREELDVCKAETIADLKNKLESIKRKSKVMQRSVSDSIEKEISNIDSLKEENYKLYTSLK